MAPPDINSIHSSMSSQPSLNPSRSMQSLGPESTTPSPRPSSTSLAAAASLNAADQTHHRTSHGSRGSLSLGRTPSDRRRSQVATNINLNDPSLPSPGELSSSDRRASQSYTTASPTSIGGRGSIATGDPNHQRRPSLGAIHNELEQEQEAQVNRMLQMIRDQQLQLEQLRSGQDNINDHHSQHPSHQNPTTAGHNISSAVVDDLTPSSERSTPFPSIHPAVPAGSTTTPAPTHRLSRSPSSSANRSPALRALPGHESSFSIEGPPSPSSEFARRNSFRDEHAYYQAETQSLTRENQMLRTRIRELERQVATLNAMPANTPPTPSNLHSSPSLRAQREDEEASAAAQVARVTAQVDKV